MQYSMTRIFFQAVARVRGTPAEHPGEGDGRRVIQPPHLPGHDVAVN